MPFAEKLQVEKIKKLVDFFFDKIVFFFSNIFTLFSIISNTYICSAKYVIHL